MEFARQLPGSHIAENDDGSLWLHLPDARPPGWRAGPVVPILLRACYDVLLRQLEDVTLGRKISRGVLVTGTPGVGKSTFAYYFMRWLAQQGRAFVYDFGDTSGSRLRLWFDYTREEVAVLEGSPDAFRDVLSQKNVWLIFDDYVPDVQYNGGVPTLILSSPKPKLFSKWGKEGVVEYFLPSWSISEHRSAWRHLRKGAQEHELQQLRYLHGGVARGILPPQDSEAAITRRRHLDNALAGVQAIDVLQAARSSVYGPELLHHVLHIKVDGDTLQPTGIKLASKYVEEQLLLQHRQWMFHETTRLLKIVRGVSPLADIAASFFEGCAASIIMGGGKWCCQLLRASVRDGGPVTLDAGPRLAQPEGSHQQKRQRTEDEQQARAPCSERDLAADSRSAFSAEEKDDIGMLGDINAGAAGASDPDTAGGASKQQPSPGQPQLVLHVPAGIRRMVDEGQNGLPGDRDWFLRSSVVNQAAWDAVVMIKGCLWFVQMTIACRHPILQQPLTQLLARVCPAPQQVVFCFVVPERNFPLFQAQQYVLPGWKQQAEPIPPELQGMPQVVMAVRNEEIIRRGSSSDAV